MTILKYILFLYLLMVKPIYLYDVFRDEFLDVDPDQMPRVLGRARGCDLITSAEFGGIDRYQAEIRYFPDRSIRLTQKSALSRTDFSEDESDWNQLYVGRTELMLPGYSIRFDESYIIRLLAHNNPLVQERIAARDAEVSTNSN